MYLASGTQSYDVPVVRGAVVRGNGPRLELYIVLGAANVNSLIH